MQSQSAGQSCCGPARKHLVRPEGNQACTRLKISDVSVLAVHWAKVLVAETKRQTQPLGRLPAILEVQAGGVDGHEPLGIADGNRRSGIVYVVRDVASQKVGEGERAGQ